MLIKKKIYIYIQKAAWFFFLYGCSSASRPVPGKRRHRSWKLPKDELTAVKSYPLAQFKYNVSYQNRIEDLAREHTPLTSQQWNARANIRVLVFIFLLIDVCRSKIPKERERERNKKAIRSVHHIFPQFHVVPLSWVIHLMWNINKLVFSQSYAFCVNKSIKCFFS